MTFRIEGIMVRQMHKTIAEISDQFGQLRVSLDEGGRREWGASEAMALGHGGIVKVHRATGMVPSTIGKGIRELKAQQHGGGEPEVARRVRAPGGGRKKKEESDPGVTGDLEALLEPVTRGDPQSPLRWTCK
ncbi:MAG: ISAzo13 family transposase, partial [Nannocystaceae bacterium]